MRTKRKINAKLDFIQKEVLASWYLNHDNLGILPYHFFHLTENKSYLMKMLRHRMRKNKILFLQSGRYFLNLDKIKGGKNEKS